MKHKQEKIKFYTFEEVLDRHIGLPGSAERDEFEFEARLGLFGHIIKDKRKEMNLSQEQLAELSGLTKAQISKLESNMSSMSIINIVKVLKALKANVKFVIELDDQKFDLA